MFNALKAMILARNNVQSIQASTCPKLKWSKGPKVKGPRVQWCTRQVCKGPRQVPKCPRQVTKSVHVKCVQGARVQWFTSSVQGSTSSVHVNCPSVHVKRPRGSNGPRQVSKGPRQVQGPRVQRSKRAMNHRVCVLGEHSH